MNNFKIKLKRIFAVILSVMIMFGILPFSYSTDVYASTATVALTNLGSLGSVTIGDHTKKGSWWQISINGSYGFCMDLGQTLRTGDCFEGETKTYSSDSSSDKSKMYSYITYWIQKKLDSKGYMGKRDYQMAQSLLWSVSEGYTSKSELVSVIKQVIENGYSTNYTASEWYEKVLCKESDAVITSTVTYWTYKGSGSSRQHIFEIKTSASVQKELEYKTYNTYALYRQRILIHKEDEDGNAISGVKFNIEAKNIDELYSFSKGDLDGSTSDSVDDEERFVVTGETSSKGNISLRLTYRLQSQEYAYLDSDVIDSATSAQIKLIKEQLDDNEIKYGENLTYDEAVELAKKDCKEQFNDVSNKYIITETQTGDDYVLDSSYAKGKTITLDTKNSWLKDKEKYPDSDGWADIDYAATTGDNQSNYSKVVRYTVVNEHKKVKLNICKVDSTIGDSTSMGEAELEGAVFGIYSDRNCTTFATLYDNSGNEIIGTNSTAMITTHYDKKTGQYLATSDFYIRCGVNYYIKEIEAPKGYLLNDEVFTVKADGKNYEEKYNSIPLTKEIPDSVIKGQIAIRKYTDDNDNNNGIVIPEENAAFEIYPASEDSYENASDLERDYLVTDKDGYAISKELPFGKYIIHQVSGAAETYYAYDNCVSIDEEGKVYTVSLFNKPFEAYLRVVKYDGNTNQIVLKSGTQYQIYKYDEKTDEEVFVTQSYVNGNVITNTSTWTTDNSGVIMTYNPLRAGTYRIYEVNAAHGYSRNEFYVEVKITNTSYTTEYSYDDDGSILASYYIAETYVVNSETYGKLSINKIGEVLLDYESEDFVYNTIPIFGSVFEVYANDDIYTQDNQGTKWYDKGDLICTITSGIGAEFSSESNGIIGYELDETTGVVTVDLPLGIYKIVEVSTPYGYIIDKDNNEWIVEFKWNNQNEKYVINSYTETKTDDNGVLSVTNALAYGKASIIKKDSRTGEGIEGAVFGLYTKDNIYSYDGELIAEAGKLLDTVTTDENGYAASELKLPIMSENYGENNQTENQSNYINSGDYYFMELSVSDSYYINSEKQYFHIEYSGIDEPVIYETALLEDVQTITQIDKYALTTGEFLDGTTLEVVDLSGNVIVEWTTGDSNSIITYNNPDELGYRNFDTVMDSDGNLIIYGLLRNNEYMLKELKPTDGYAFAAEINFIIDSSEGEIKNISMYNDTTKVNISKQDATTGDELPGAKLVLYDNDKNIIDEWVSTEETHYIEGVLIAGNEYTLHEESAPDGYNISSDVTFKVSTNGSIDTVVMKDEITSTTEVKINTPKTGFNITEKLKQGVSVICIIIAIYILIVWYMKRICSEDKKKKTRQH